MAVKKTITVESQVDIENVLGEIRIADAVEYYGEDLLLKHIGKEACIEYFGIEEAEQ